jgi:hypothetical protein
MGRAVHTSLCSRGHGESGVRARLAFRISGGSRPRSVATSCRKLRSNAASPAEFTLETSFVGALAPSRGSGV